MNELRSEVFDIVLATSSSQIAILIEVPLHVAIHAGDQGVKPDVKLPALVEQRPFTVLLNYVTALLAVNDVVANDLSDLRQVLANCDAAAPVCVLAGFYNPEALAHGRVIGQAVRLLGIVVHVLELGERAVRKTLANMVRQRDELERLLPSCLVVNFHVVVNGLFVRQMEVVLHVVCCPHVVRSDVLFLGFLRLLGIHPARSNT